MEVPNCAATARLFILSGIGGGGLGEESNYVLLRDLGVGKKVSYLFANIFC